MPSEKQKRIAEILTMFSEMYEKEISEAYSSMYISCLESYPLEKIEAAATHILRTKTFNKYPLPAEFIQHIDPQEDMDVRTHRAQEKVFDMMERHGAYSTVEFDDPVIHHTLVHLHGSWIAACNSRRSCRTETDDRFWRKDFESTYARIVRSGSQAESPPLIGIYDKQNEERGYITAGLVKPMEPARLPNHRTALQTNESNHVSVDHCDSEKQEQIITKTKS